MHRNQPGLQVVQIVIACLRSVKALVVPLQGSRALFSQSGLGIPFREPLPVVPAQPHPLRLVILLGIGKKKENRIRFPIRSAPA